MAYCVKCGAKVEDDLRFCPQCGAEIPHRGNYDGIYGNYSDGTGNHFSGQTQNSTGYQNSFQDIPYGEGSADRFDASEVKRNKGMGVLSYLGILLLIPLLAGDKRSSYVRHHINQGLVLFIVSSIIDFLDGKWLWNFYSWFDFGKSVLSWCLEIADFACFILLIMGIVSACKGTRKELPIIGKIKILK